MTNTLTPGELVTKTDREKHIRAAIEQVFEGGCPASIIVYADLTGSGTVRVSCVGAVVELRALLLAGTNQCVAMLDGVDAQPTGAVN